MEMTKHHKYPEEVKEIEIERRLKKVWQDIGHPGVDTKELCRRAVDVMNRRKGN